MPELRRLCAAYLNAGRCSGRAEGEDAVGEDGEHDRHPFSIFGRKKCHKT